MLPSNLMEQRSFGFANEATVLNPRVPKVGDFSNINAKRK